MDDDRGLRRSALLDDLMAGLAAMKDALGIPGVVCLCGSTRFMDAFRKANLTETLAGRIVLTVGCDTKSDSGLGLGENVKTKLDELHRRKIDLADVILVLNVGGYIGESTRQEIEYATATRKLIRYLEPLEPPTP